MTSYLYIYFLSVCECACEWVCATSFLHSICSIFSFIRIPFYSIRCHFLYLLMLRLVQQPFKDYFVYSIFHTTLFFLVVFFLFFKWKKKKSISVVLIEAGCVTGAAAAVAACFFFFCVLFCKWIFICFMVVDYGFRTKQQQRIEKSSAMLFKMYTLCFILALASICSTHSENEYQTCTHTHTHSPQSLIPTRNLKKLTHTALVSFWF